MSYITTNIIAFVRLCLSVPKSGYTSATNARILFFLDYLATGRKVHSRDAKLFTSSEFLLGGTIIISGKSNIRSE